MPNLYILTGSNGAGKSTVGGSYFPEGIGTIFDGDKLFLKKKSSLWQSGLKVQKELNRQASHYVEETFRQLVADAIGLQADFAYEGHFSEDTSWEVPVRLKALHYGLHLVFLGLNSIYLSSNRVLIRAKEGGHFVDPLTLRNNFYGNLRQLDRRFTLFDSLQVIDTSGVGHRALLWMEDGHIKEAVPKDQLPEWFIGHLPHITAFW